MLHPAYANTGQLSIIISYTFNANRLSPQMCGIFFILIKVLWFNIANNFRKLGYRKKDN